MNITSLHSLALLHRQASVGNSWCFPSLRWKKMEMSPSHTCLDECNYISLDFASFNRKCMLAARETVKNLQNETINRPCNYTFMHALFYVQQRRLKRGRFKKPSCKMCEPARGKDTGTAMKIEIEKGNC